jgi:glutamine amidotransferase
MRIVIVDYGAGNLRSVERAAAHAGYCAVISSSPDDVRAAETLIVPGVGAAADTMRNLRERRLVEPILDFIADGRPFLGICMGLQALLTVSEEGGEHPCLGVVPGRVRRLPPGLKVPQMGWNTVGQRRAHPVFEGVAGGSYFYFVHSYYPAPDDGGVVIGETDYGVVFPSVIARGNIVATQFHPEKSGDVGLRFYRNFLSWAEERCREGKRIATGR